MILIEGKGIYLCTPATGSRSTSKTMVRECGGRWLNKHATHHVHLKEMYLLDGRPEPVFTTIRDPYDYVLSRYWYKFKSPDRERECSIEEYIPLYAREVRTGQFGRMFGSQMLPYRDCVDRFFLFEDGLKPIFEFIGFPDVEIETVGKNTPMQMLQWGPRLTVHDISDEAKGLIEDHFAMELALYRQVRDKRKAA
jgi:hypothetical protein